MIVLIDHEKYGEDRYMNVTNFEKTGEGLYKVYQPNGVITLNNDQILSFEIRE